MPRTLIAAIAWLAFAASAHAFDCKHATAPAQIVTCSDPALLRLYEERQHAYEEARSRLSGKEARKLRADERRWIKSYPEKCGATGGGKLPQPVPAEMQACFKSANQDRIAYLQAYPPAAAPAAAAPSGAAPAKDEAQPATAAAPAEKAMPSAAPPNKEMPAAMPAKQAPAAAPASKEARSVPPASKAVQPKAAQPAAAAGTLRLKFTFGCQSPAKLTAVLHALARNDYSFPLSQSDCLPIPDGTTANVLSRSGNIAKVRLCSSETGCTEIFVDAGEIENGSAEAKPH